MNPEAILDRADVAEKQAQNRLLLCTRWRKVLAQRAAEVMSLRDQADQMSGWAPDTHAALMAVVAAKEGMLAEATLVTEHQELLGVIELECAAAWRTLYVVVTSEDGT